jgi:type IV pilus assembly protein PilN
VIKVNLLATGPGAAPAREWFPREQRAALLGLCALVVTGLAIGGWWYYLHNQRTAVEARITTAEAQMVRLREAAKLVEKTTARKTELSERLGVIERLRESKRAPVDLLTTLSASLPDGLWLLDVKQAGRSVQVDGRAMSLTAVTDFAERLQNSGVFNRPVEILTTTTETLDETTVVRFSVKADVVAPEPPASAALGAAASTAPATAAVRAGA